MMILRFILVSILELSLLFQNHLTNGALDLPSGVRPLHLRLNISPSGPVIPTPHS